MSETTSKWHLILALGASYLFVTLVVIVNPDFAYSRALERPIIFEVMVWSCAIISGLAVGYLAWRRWLERGYGRAAAAAILAGSAVAVLQIFTLRLWAIVIFFVGFVVLGALGFIG